MPTIRLNDPTPGVLDGRQVRAAAFQHARDTLLARFLGTHRAAGIGLGYSAMTASLAGVAAESVSVDGAKAAVAEARHRYPDADIRHAPPKATGLTDGWADLVYPRRRSTRSRPAPASPRWRRSVSSRHPSAVWCARSSDAVAAA